VTQPLRVAFLTHALYLGGAERWIISLCQEFDRKRVRPTVLAVNNWRQKNDMVVAAMPEDVAVLPTEHCWHQWPAFADVVIGWGRCEIGKHVTSKGIPGVMCLHGAKLCDWTKETIADTLTSGAKITGVNEVCRLTLPEPYRHLMTVLANGADESRVIPTCGRAEIRGSLGIASDRKVVAHIGRLHFDKDIKGLAKAVGKLSEEWLLLVCGPKPDHPLDMGEISEAAGGRMIYLPPRDHVGDLLAAADVFALLSPSEAHPLAVTEAWLAGKPVVCTDLPWLRSIESQHGAMCHRVNVRHEPHSVAEAIQRAYADSALVSNTQRIAKEHYTAGAMARRWEDWLIKEFGEIRRVLG
jgi:glycosyltransferase involved in cell wall biosynthesis